MLVLLALLSLIAGALLLLILSVIDLRIGLLPNEFVLSFLICGLIFHGATAFSFLALTHIALGGLVGSGLLYIIHLLAEKFYKEDSLGLGDVKLMGAAGAWLGPHYILVALSLGALAGIVHGLGLALYRKRATGAPLNLSALCLPAGPGFAAGIFITALYAFKTFPAMILP